MQRTIKSFYDLVTVMSYGPRSTPERTFDLPHQGQLYVGAKDRWTEENTDKKGAFHQDGFRFPEQFTEAQSWARHYARKGWDVYWCPNLMEQTRSKNGAARVWVLSFEIDGPLTDSELYRTLRPIELHSGRPGHRHVYILLNEPMEPIAANALCERIAKAVTDEHDKSQDNAFLRIPRTVNRKAEADGARVLFSRTKARVWSPAALKDVVGSTDPGTAPHEPSESPLPAELRAVIAEHDRNPDRSKGSWGILMACAEAGLDKDEAIAIVRDSASWDHYGKKGEHNGLRQLKKEANKAYHRATPRASTRNAAGPQVVTESGVYTIRGQRMSDIEEKAMEWLWYRWLPKGKITILEADPGLSKSLLVLYLGAILTAGDRWPDGARVEERGAFGYMSSEDDPASGIKPRLRIAGADMSKVHDLTMTTAADGTEVMTHLGMVAALEEYIRDNGIKLLVVDTLMSFLPPGTKEISDKEIRNALGDLVPMLERVGCTMVLIRHLRKTSGGPMVHQGGGSIGIAGLARLVMRVFRDDRDGSDPDHDRLLVGIKSNVGPLGRSIGYRVGTTGEEPHTLPTLTWTGTADDVSVTSLEAAAKSPAETKRRGVVDDLVSKVDDAGSARRGEWLGRTELMEAAGVSADDIAPATWSRAIAKLRDAGRLADRRGQVTRGEVNEQHYRWV